MGSSLLLFTLLSISFSSWLTSPHHGMHKVYVSIPQHLIISYNLLFQHILITSAHSTTLLHSLFSRCFSQSSESSSSPDLSVGLVGLLWSFSGAVAGAVAGPTEASSSGNSSSVFRASIGLPRLKELMNTMNITCWVHDYEVNKMTVTKPLHFMLCPNSQRLSGLWPSHMWIHSNRTPWFSLTSQEQFLSDRGELFDSAVQLSV